MVSEWGLNALLRGTFLVGSLGALCSVMELVGVKHVLEAKPSSAAVKHLHVVIEVGTSWLRNNINPFKADGSPEPLRTHLAAAMFCRERDVSREEVLDHK